MKEVIAPENGSGRIYHIDNLRIFLTALVVCHHQAIGFGAPGGWYYVLPAPQDIPSRALLTLFVAVNQAFSMSLFFLVAAYFTRMSRLKKGMPAFVRDRLIRLGIPLAVYFFILNPNVVYLARLFSVCINSGYLEFLKNYAPACFGFGPMWFVLSLIIFTAFYLAVSGVNCGGGTERHVPLPGNRWVFTFILLVGAFTFFVRQIYPVGTGLLGLQIGYFPLYACMFGFGIAAHRYSWLDQMGKRQANQWFCSAILLILMLPVIVFLGGAFVGKEDAFRGGLTWQAYVYAAWEPFVCVGISMKLLVFFRDRLNRANAFTAHLSKSTYTVYIIHPFFVVAATRLAKDLPIPPLALVLLVCPLVLLVTFVCANFVRQAPLLNKVL